MRNRERYSLIMAADSLTLRCSGLPTVTSESQHQTEETERRRESLRDGRTRRRSGIRKQRWARTLLATALVPTVGGQCIPLEGSTTCPAFGSAQISTSDALKSNFPFLAFVSDTASFDKQFQDYLAEEYVTFKYQSVFGCQNMTLPETKDYYARFTQTVLCSRMIQDSKSDCGLSDDMATPVCAETCGQFAHSEQIIVANEATCVNAKDESFGIIKSDLAICSDPSLDRDCIRGYDNESTNCGFNDNLPGLCLYCADSSPESTDTCCYNANAEEVCEGVALPTISNLPPIATVTASSTPSPEPKKSGLSGGVIAGITIGAVVGVALIAGVLFFLWRRRRHHPPSFEQRQFPRRPPSLTFTAVGPGYETLPGPRVQRMSAIETASLSEPRSPPHISISHPGSRHGLTSDSDFGLSDAPFALRAPNLYPAPRARNTSLSSTSIMDPSSPGGAEKTVAGGGFGEEGEMLEEFKDYYSDDIIRAGDKVAVLWAYAPRANDEFELDRGDMLKVVGIWNDGWATGVRVPGRIKEWGWKKESQRGKEMRDSGLPEGSVAGTEPGTRTGGTEDARPITEGRESPAAASSTTAKRVSTERPSADDSKPEAAEAEEQPVEESEIKAFPLVCVCLPQHWERTVDMEITQQWNENGSGSGSGGSDYEEYRSTTDAERGSGGEGLRVPGMYGYPGNRTGSRGGSGVREKASSRFKDDLGIPR